ncbi:glycosyltransferase [Vibrio artabrorum]|uniref:glycosyltransferase n=1 Tax=Vibrio artabrorum TaxID=446374 RepID=UPI00355243F2
MNKIKIEKKLTFLISGLSGGGFEGVCINLANGLVNLGWKVDIVCLNLKKVDLLDKVDKDVNLINLNINRFAFSFIPILKFLKNNNCKNIVSFHYYFSSMLVLHNIILGNKFNLIARNNIALSESENHNSKSITEKILFLIVKFLYPKVDHLISQCEDMKKDLVKNYNFEAEKVTTIYNPVNKHLENQYVDDDSKRDGYVLFIGRLAEQKRLGVALKVFSEISRDFPELRFKIIGQGEKENELRELADTYGIGNLVDFEGFKKDLADYYRKAKLVILTSSYEGFPNVLVESITLGTPVVSFDCPTGPREIIKNDINGFLVENNDENSLKIKVVEAIKRNWNREVIHKTALRYKNDVVLNEYENLFLEVIKGNGNEK